MAKRYVPAGCRCYVRYLDEEVLFCLLPGSHNLACPAYQRCLDPVDQAHAEEFRARAEITAPTSQRIG